MRQSEKAKSKAFPKLYTAYNKLIQELYILQFQNRVIGNKLIELGINVDELLKEKAQQTFIDKPEVKDADIIKEQQPDPNKEV